MKREDGSGQLDRIGYHPTWQIGGPTAVMYFQANGVPLLSNDGAQPGFGTPAGAEALVTPVGEATIEDRGPTLFPEPPPTV